MGLNPKKCAFNMQSRTLLGYIISAKRIDRPHKSYSNNENGEPRNISQFMPYLERLQSIRIFISQLEKKIPFTQLL